MSQKFQSYEEIHIFLYFCCLPFKFDFDTLLIIYTTYINIYYYTILELIAWDEKLEHIQNLDNHFCVSWGFPIHYKVHK